MTFVVPKPTLLGSSSSMSSFFWAIFRAASLTATVGSIYRFSCPGAAGRCRRSASPGAWVPAASGPEEAGGGSASFFASASFSSSSSFSILSPSPAELQLFLHLGPSRLLLLAFFRLRLGSIDDVVIVDPAERERQRPLGPGGHQDVHLLGKDRQRHGPVLERLLLRTGEHLPGRKDQDVLKNRLTPLQLGLLVGLVTAPRPRGDRGG